MKSMIRILLLSAICITGGLQERLYAQVLEIYQIKVSVGHATLVVYKDASLNVKKSVLIDVGNDTDDAELIREVIHKHAINKLDRVYITHGDKDHWGGLGGDSDDGLINKLVADATEFTTNISPTSGSTIELKYTGAKEVSVSYPIDLTGDIGGRNMNNSPQGLRKSLNNAEASTNWTVQDWAYDDQNYLLGASDTEPILVTLAADCKLKNWTSTDATKLMDGCDGRAGIGKNNRSGVLLVKWGLFTFLIQGDLQAANKDPNGSPADRIAASIEAYNPNTNPGTRFPDQWADATTQNAKTIKEKTYKDLVKDGTITDGQPSTTGIVRDNIQGLVYTGESSYDPTGKAGFKRKRVSDFKIDIEDHVFFKSNTTTVNYLNKRNFIAWPDRGRWELAKLIDDYNGGNGYGKVSVGLVPHHGGLTANLWFRTNYAIFGTPAHASQSHPHPEFYCVRAVGNTVGARNMYFTYLSDDVSSTSNKYDRSNYINAMEFTPLLRHFSLDNRFDYFKVKVSNNGDEFIISESNNDESDSENLTNPLITSEQY